MLVLIHALLLPATFSIANVNSATTIKLSITVTKITIAKWIYVSVYVFVESSDITLKQRK